MRIIKANGDFAAYEPEKIVKSLERAGADHHTILKVLSMTEKEIFDGIDTKNLYKIVYKNLRKESRHVADKYHLKSAIMELGPTGFPFEKYIAALLEREGFKTLTNQTLQGHCVKHEVDVLAEKDNRHFMLECKFHRASGNICDVKQALYTYARFLDLAKVWVKTPGYQEKLHQGWLVTNTRLSSDAESYGKCVGLGLLGWNYPKGNSLRERIDRGGLYPVTCFTNLTKREKQSLLDKKIILCQTVHENPAVLNGIGLTEIRKKRVIEEATNICVKQGVTPR